MCSITQPLTKSEVFPSVAPWIDLEGVMLSEISQSADRERQILNDFIYMESKKTKQMDKQNKKGVIEQGGSCQKGGWMDRGKR